MQRRPNENQSQCFVTPIHIIRENEISNFKKNPLKYSYTKIPKTIEHTTADT